MLGPAGGILVDRFNRKRIMISCDIMRGLVVLCFLTVQQADQVWMVYFLALAQESLWTCSHLARQSSIPGLCRPEEINVANGLGGTTWSVMLAAGAASGGFVTAYFGWQVAICIDSLTFFCSALIISRVLFRQQAMKDMGRLTLKKLSGYTDLVDGIRYLNAHRNVIPLIFIKGGWGIAGGGILVMLTVFGEQVFAGDRNLAGGQSGILYSMRGLGAALGPILAWRLLGDHVRGMFRAIGYGFCVSAVSYFLFSQSPTLFLASICVLCAHCGGAVQWVFSTSLLHRFVDDRYRGRVFSAEMALMTVFVCCSTWGTGQALSVGADPRTIVLVLSLLFLIPGFLWLVYISVSGKHHTRSRKPEDR